MIICKYFILQFHYHNSFNVTEKQKKSLKCSLLIDIDIILKEYFVIKYVSRVTYSFVLFFLLNRANILR